MPLARCRIPVRHCSNVTVFFRAEVTLPLAIPARVRHLPLPPKAHAAAKFKSAPIQAITRRKSCPAPRAPQIRTHGSMLSRSQKSSRGPENLVPDRFDRLNLQ